MNLAKGCVCVEGRLFPKSESARWVKDELDKKMKEITYSKRWKDEMEKGIKLV